MRKIFTTSLYTSYCFVIWQWPNPRGSFVVPSVANVNILRNLALGMIKSLKWDDKSCYNIRDKGVNSWKDVEKVIRDWEGEQPSGSGWFEMSFEFVHHPSVKQDVAL